VENSEFGNTGRACIMQRGQSMSKCASRVPAAASCDLIPEPSKRATFDSFSPDLDAGGDIA
jgi:hypothetical protein